MSSFITRMWSFNTMEERSWVAPELAALVGT